MTIFYNDTNTVYSVKTFGRHYNTQGKLNLYKYSLDSYVLWTVLSPAKHSNLWSNSLQSFLLSIYL